MADFGLGIKEDCGCKPDKADKNGKCTRICEPVKMIPTPTALTCWEVIKVSILQDECKQILQGGIRPHTHVRWLGAGELWLAPSKELAKDKKGMVLQCNSTFSIDMWCGELWAWSEDGGEKALLINVWG